MREVFRDDWLLVVDKPSGMATQPDDTTRGDDLYSRLQRTHLYVGLHHRLDRPASGLVLVTLDPAANAPIADGFRTHTIARTYRVVLAGDRLSLGDTVTWNAPLDGERAVTHVTIVGASDGFLAAEVRLETGRTHQIRRHAALAGAPVVGDRRHGGDVGTWWPRLALHASDLRLRHPVRGVPLALHAPLPDDVIDLWRDAGGPV